MTSTDTRQADTFAAEIAERYPAIARHNRQLAAQLAAYDRQVAEEGFESTLNAPVMPERIKALHPFAH